jgi:hypothetical protein
MDATQSCKLFYYGITYKNNVRSKLEIPMMGRSIFVGVQQLFRVMMSMSETRKLTQFSFLS